MEINAVNQILKKEENYIWKKTNIQQHTTWKTSTHIFAWTIYKTNTKLTESIPVILLGMSIMICVPPPLLPQNNASCTMLVIWRVKCLAATFRHVQGHIHICWLSVCRSFVISTFVMFLPCRVNVLYKYTDYNFDFF